MSGMFHDPITVIDDHDNDHDNNHFDTFWSFNIAKVQAAGENHLFLFGYLGHQTSPCSTGMTSSNLPWMIKVGDFTSLHPL